MVDHLILKESTTWGKAPLATFFFFFNFWCILGVTISVNFAFSLKNAREERKLLQRGDSQIQNLAKELTDNWDSQYQVTKYVGCAKTRRKIKARGGAHGEEGKWEHRKSGRYKAPASLK